jgi:hypothetical protein
MGRSLNFNAREKNHLGEHAVLLHSQQSTRMRLKSSLCELCFPTL